MTIKFLLERKLDFFAFHLFLFSQPSTWMGWVYFGKMSCPCRHRLAQDSEIGLEVSKPGERREDVKARGPVGA